MKDVPGSSLRSWHSCLVTSAPAGSRSAAVRAPSFRSSPEASRSPKWRPAAVAGWARRWASWAVVPTVLSSAVPGEDGPLLNDHPVDPRLTCRCRARNLLALAERFSVRLRAARLTEHDDISIPRGSPAETIHASG